MMYYLAYTEKGKQRLLTKFQKRHFFALKLKNAWFTIDRSFAEDYSKYCKELFDEDYQILDLKSAMKVLGL